MPRADANVKWRTVRLGVAPTMDLKRILW